LIDSFLNSTQLELNGRFNFRATFETIFSSRIIQQIIEVEGCNDYREGRSGGDIRSYNRTERKERYQRRKAGRRPGGSEVEVDEAEADEKEVDEEDW
jgi:hypothetical protein